jgi:hypothetical protein
MATLEHVNITVSDADLIAQKLVALFDWSIRWSGAAMEKGRTVHVGTENSYIALYSQGGTQALGNSYLSPGGLNHIGIVVDDLVAAEARIKSAGYTPQNHADYEPGKRFYFDFDDGIEIEVIDYD